jgi:long-chain acyl-CoA synthetase
MTSASASTASASTASSVSPPAQPTAPEPASTLPALLLHQAASRPGATAMRHKQLGIWQATTWGQYAERAASVGIGLRVLGIRPGDRVALHAGNRPEWLIADLAIQGIGATTVGIYPTSQPLDVEYLLSQSDTKVLIAEDEEQLDKAWSVREQLPELTSIVVMDTRGVRQLDDPLVMSLVQLEDLGRNQPDADPLAEYSRLVATLDPIRPAVLCYTSGTTGATKGALLSHLNLTAAGRAFCTVFGVRPDDEALSYLPLCHIAERIVSEINPLLVGYVVNFGEGGASLVDALRQVQPTVFFGVPKVWERTMVGVETRMQDASTVKRAAYRFARSQGEAVAPKRLAGRMSPLDRLRSRVAWLLVFRPLKEKLGFSRVRVAISAAAPIAADVLEYFWSMGVGVREGYGQTEGTAMGTYTSATPLRLGSAGTPLPGVELRLAPDGEILVRSPGVFLGYLNDEEATSEAVDGDGWLHSGDIGEMDDDGYLTIVDRKKDALIQVVEEMYS